MNKKVIKLTENELNNLIDKCINETIYCDYSQIDKAASYSNPLTIAMFNPKLLEEGLIKTYPIEKTVSYIKSYFNLRDVQIKVLECDSGIEQIMVMVPPIADNIKIMEKAMNYFGYYLAAPKDVNNISGGLVWLQFEPKIQNDISQQLRKEETFIYHITPAYNRGKILKIGFSPRSKNSLFNFPHRVYFIRGSVSDRQIKTIGEQLCNANNSEGNDGSYVLFVIDLNKIPENIPFYFDSNYEYGVYTNSNIKPDAIVDVKEIEF